MEIADSYKPKFMVNLSNNGSDNKDCKQADLPSLEKNESADALRSFCSMANFGNAVVCLSQELQNLGIKYKLIEGNGGRLNLLSLVNSCWDIIQMYHVALRDGNALHDYRRRDVADINHLQGSVKELKMTLEEKDRILQESQERDRQAIALQKTLSSKLKAEKDEVRRLGSILQQREAQHLHIVRRKETEMTKLQDRLQRMLTGKKSEARLSTLTMTGSLNRSDRARGRWKTDNTSIKHEEEMYRKVLSQYEVWIGQLTDERDKLQEYLTSAAAKVAKIASLCSSPENNLISDVDFLNGPSSIFNTESSDHNPVPCLNFGLVQDHISKEFDANIQFILTALQNKESIIEDSPSDADDKLETEEELEDSLDSSLQNRIDYLTESQCVEKELQLKEQMNVLLEEKKKLQKERETFAVAAVRLNKERADFEAEKINLLRCQFLEDLPNSLRNHSGDPFSPTALGKSPLDHSITELYGDSPRNRTSIPSLISPTRNIVRTNQPVTQQHRRRKSSQIPLLMSGGKSAPATRNSSLNRCHDDDVFASPRSKTLERPSRSVSSQLREERVTSPSRSACYSVLRTRSLDAQSHHQQSCHLSSTPSTKTCPSVNFRTKNKLSCKENLGELIADEGKPSSKTWFYHGSSSTSYPTPRSKVMTECGDECVTSGDSGFYHEDADSSYGPSTHAQDVQTNLRLSALETGLIILLEQVKSRSSQNERPPQRDTNLETSKCLSEAASGDHNTSRGAEEITAMSGTINDQPSHCHDLSKLLLSGDFKPPSTSTAFPLFDQKLSSSIPKPCARRISSTPGGVDSIRRNRRDSRHGEDYWKRIQNSFAKWYFRNT